MTDHANLPSGTESTDRCDTADSSASGRIAFHDAALAAEEELRAAYNYETAQEARKSTQRTFKP